MNHETNYSITKLQNDSMISSYAVRLHLHSELFHRGRASG